VRTADGAVLIAEGDRRLRAALARAIRRRGLPVVLAGSAADAIDMAAAERPILLLLDTGLAGWLDVAVTVRDAFAPAPPMLLTGPPRRSSASCPPANRRYLTKPFEPHDAAARVAREIALASRPLGTVP
jgi:DNA-binding response OmpR family regulator